MRLQAQLFEVSIFHFTGALILSSSDHLRCNSSIWSHTRACYVQITAYLSHLSVGGVPG